MSVMPDYPRPDSSEKDHDLHLLKIEYTARKRELWCKLGDGNPDQVPYNRARRALDGWYTTERTAVLDRYFGLRKQWDDYYAAKQREVTSRRSRYVPSWHA